VAPAEKPADTRASYAIESEMDLTRERLAATIDQLVYRASPKTIARREVANVKAIFVDAQGQPRTDNILKAAGAVAGLVVLVVLMRKVAS
jgi:hypothetical protein